MLPNYLGIIINHYKDPYEKTSRIQWKIRGYFWWLSWGSKILPILVGRTQSAPATFVGSRKAELSAWEEMANVGGGIRTWKIVGWTGCWGSNYICNGIHWVWIYSNDTYLEIIPFWSCFWMLGTFASDIWNPISEMVPGRNILPFTLRWVPRWQAVLLAHESLLGSCRSQGGGTIQT